MSDPGSTLGAKLLTSGIKKGASITGQKVVDRLFSSNYRAEFETATVAFDDTFRNEFELHLEELREAGALNKEIETDWEKISRHYSIDQLDSLEDAARHFTNILLELNNIDTTEHDEIQEAIQHKALVACQEGYEAFLAELEPEPAQVAIFNGQKTIKESVEEITDYLEQEFKRSQKPTRATKFEIDNAEGAADLVLYQSFAEPIKYVSRGEFTDFTGGSQCIIIGPEKAGKTRSLAWLTQKAPTLYDVDEIIVIGEDYTHQTDYPAIRESIQEDNILVVWDDITGTPGGSSVELFKHTVYKLYNDVPGKCRVMCTLEPGQGLGYQVSEILSKSGHDTHVSTLSMLTSSQLRQLVDVAAEYYDVAIAEADRDIIEEEIRSQKPLPGTVIEIIKTISTDTGLLTEDATNTIQSVSDVWKYRYRNLDTTDQSLLITAKLCQQFGLHQRRELLKQIFIDLFDNQPFAFEDSLDRLSEDGWIQPIVPNRQENWVQDTEFVYIPTQRLNAISASIEEYYLPLSDWVQDNRKVVRNILPMKTAADLNYNLAIRLGDTSSESQRIADHFEEAIEIGVDDPEYHIAYGIHLGKNQEDAGEVKAQFDQGYECAPKDPKALFYSAIGFLLDLKFQQAAERLTTAVQENPDRIYFQHLLRDSGFSEFIQETAPIFESQPSHTSLIALAVYAYLDQDKGDHALELSKQTADMAEGGAENLIAARAMEAVFNHQNQNVDSEFIQRIIQCYHWALSELSSPNISTELGTFYLRVGDFDQAVSELQDALESGDDLAKAWSRFATALTHSERDTNDSEDWRENPEIAFQIALNKKPQQLEFIQNYIKYLINDGRYADAVQQFEQLKKIEELNAEMKVKYAETLYRSGSIEDALDICEEFRYSNDYPADVQMMASQLRHEIKREHGPGWGNKTEEEGSGSNDS